MRPALKVARIAGASRHSRLETEPRAKGAFFFSGKSKSVYFNPNVDVGLR